MTEDDNNTLTELNAERFKRIDERFDGLTKLHKAHEVATTAQVNSLNTRIDDLRKPVIQLAEDAGND